MIEFAIETLTLLPFLFVTYLVLEALEAKAGGALEGFFGRTRYFGPLFGSLAGVVPQCGLSAAAASFYAGGVISAGTLVAVFLSTSDELIPVLVSRRAGVGLIGKLVLFKCVAGVLAGFAVDASLRLAKRFRRAVSVSELCEHSRCGCSRHSGIVVPALIHTLEIFVFIVLVSGAIELCMRYFGEECLMNMRLATPVLGEAIGALLGLVPNCAVSVAGAELYCKGAMSAGALLSASFTGSGLGLLVLFRTNRSLRENLSIAAALVAFGMLFGLVLGPFLR